MPNSIPVRSLSISRSTSENLRNYAETYGTNESYILECALKEFFEKYQNEEVLHMPDGTMLTAR